MSDAWILDAVRTPFGRHAGGLSHVRTDDLAAIPLRELLRRNPSVDPASIDDVVYGNVNGAGEDNRNVARMALLLAGLPCEVPGVSVNRLCGSGGEAVVQAARQIRADDASMVVAGGVEGMSRSPFIVPRPTAGFPGNMEMHASTVGWRLANPTFPAEWVVSLGRCAELVAAELGVTRDEQDEWALRSHRRAAAAWDGGRHDRVVEVDGVCRDESVRTDTDLAKLARLAPAFSASGTVTAGNSSPINDGAIALLMGDDTAAEATDRPPLGRLLGSAVVGVRPDQFPLAPVDAIRKLVARLGRDVGEIDVIEINEAFAAVVLCCLQHLPDVDPENVNPNGGAIALGHPLGASLSRVVVDLCAELGRRGGGVGIASACIGVGQGIAIACEVPR